MSFISNPYLTCCENGTGTYVMAEPDQRLNKIQDVPATTLIPVKTQIGRLGIVDAKVVAELTTSAEIQRYRYYGVGSEDILKASTLPLSLQEQSRQASKFLSESKPNIPSTFEEAYDQLWRISPNHKKGTGNHFTYEELKLIAKNLSIPLVGNKKILAARLTERIRKYHGINT